jgi:enoyl-CoA hydratase
MTSSYETILVERKENYAILRFNRPDKFNAANAQIFKDLAAAVAELDADPAIGCIILTGQTFTHPKKGTPYHVFSAGADVEQFASVGKIEAGYEFIKLCFEPFKAIEHLKRRSSPRSTVRRSASASRSGLLRFLLRQHQCQVRAQG